MVFKMSRDLKTFTLKLGSLLLDEDFSFASPVVVGKGGPLVVGGGGHEVRLLNPVLA